MGPETSQEAGSRFLRHADNVGRYMRRTLVAAEKSDPSDRLRTNKISMKPAMFRLPLRSPWLVCLALYVASTRAAIRHPTSDETYRDCSDLSPYSPSGVYMLHPSLEPSASYVPAYCDMGEDGGGWTVIIRRNDYEFQEDFYRDWDSYKRGFGYLEEAFYWGNENIWMLTSKLDRRYQVHIWLEDWNGDTRHALYQKFEIESETAKFRLHVGKYSGDAGDDFSYNNNQSFSTFDRDNDMWSAVNCATRGEAAWWYRSCTNCQLTGKYYEGGNSGDPDHGIVWRAWKSTDPYSLKAAIMKIKPSDKK